MNLIEKTKQLNALLVIVNSSQDFEGLIVSWDGIVSNREGQNNMSGKPTFTLNFDVEFNAEKDYPQQHGFFKDKTLCEIENNWSWVFEESGKSKQYDLMSKFYVLAKQQGIDISWSYQRALGKPKKTYMVYGVAQGLLN